MNIETKYNIGDEVWFTREDTCEKVMACETCNDTKVVDIKGVNYKCPNCVTGHNVMRWKHRHFVSGKGKIGSVRYEFTVARYEESKEERSYMLDTTGVGSGTIWYEKFLFPTKELAQNYCDNKNREIDSEP